MYFAGLILVMRLSFRVKVCFLLQNPKKFEDVFDEMIYFLEQTDHWDSTEMELAAKGVSSIFLNYIPLGYLHIIFT